MTRPRPVAAVSRLLVAALLAAGFVTALGPMAHPDAVAASTADTMESQILASINAERAKYGLVALRVHSGLADLAGDRAAYMASIGAMQHISCLSCTLSSRGIQWYGVGEVIASNNWPWGSQSADVVFKGWMSSSMHRAILLSNKFNYIGIGVAYRSSNHSTYASAVLTESKDRTNPWAKMSTASKSGANVTWTWSGADTTLQTHTAGLKNFDVQYRYETGAWSTIRSGTTAKSLTVYDRIRGHWYGVRVRARDNLGYVSGYSAEMRIWVP